MTKGKLKSVVRNFGRREREKEREERGKGREENVSGDAGEIYIPHETGTINF